MSFIINIMCCSIPRQDNAKDKDIHSTPAMQRVQGCMNAYDI